MSSVGASSFSWTAAAAGESAPTRPLPTRQLYYNPNTPLLLWRTYLASPRPSCCRCSAALGGTLVRGICFALAPHDAIGPVHRHLIQLSTPDLPVDVVGAGALEGVFQLSLHAIQRDDDEDVKHADEVARLAAILRGDDLCVALFPAKVVPAKHLQVTISARQGARHARHSDIVRGAYCGQGGDQ